MCQNVSVAVATGLPYNVGAKLTTKQQNTLVTVAQEAAQAAQAAATAAAANQLSGTLITGAAPLVSASSITSLIPQSVMTTDSTSQGKGLAPPSITVSTVTTGSQPSGSSSAGAQPTSLLGEVTGCYGRSTSEAVSNYVNNLTDDMNETMACVAGAIAGAGYADTIGPWLGDKLGLNDLDLDLLKTVLALSGCAAGLAASAAETPPGCDVPADSGSGDSGGDDSGSNS